MGGLCNSENEWKVRGRANSIASMSALSRGCTTPWILSLLVGLPTAQMLFCSWFDIETTWNHLRKDAREQGFKDPDDKVKAARKRFLDVISNLEQLQIQWVTLSYICFIFGVCHGLGLLTRKSRTLHSLKWPSLLLLRSVSVLSRFDPFF